MRSNSPLRYPGGKACLFELISSLIECNEMLGCEYAEPYAGGAGLALLLLQHKFVSHIHLNDYDPAIWSFWHSILNDTDNFLKKICEAKFAVEEWRHQKHLLSQKDISPLELGFSAFYLNRVNRSGILKGGLIGGIAQSGLYKMDCRFNKKNLSKRIEKIAEMKNKITLSQLDAVAFLEIKDKQLPKNALIYSDPPYFNKGPELYMNAYKKEEHEIVSKTIKSLKHPWILTYDNAAEIQHLYQNQQVQEIPIRYSLQSKKQATELLILSNDLQLKNEMPTDHQKSFLFNA